MPVLVITCASIYLHNVAALRSIFDDPALLATWMVTLAFVVIQLALAWSQKAVSVNPRDQAALDQLYVTVVIPCYNEDPQILDRTIVSLVSQTRLPDHIEVVDDGSTVDYSAVRNYWLTQQLPSVRFTWVRQRNAGKKHAQAVTFTSDHDADIFVTIDSDSALDRRAINEGLKPFADPRVVSVAGLETAINIDRNLLTRAIGHRSLAFQLFAMSAQSAARGNVLINPGAFSLYWAPLIRKVVPSYIGETFFGMPVTLGDDTALTLYALLHGRAVHQPTAVSLPVYPETLAHHLRQWTRWMRASTIRMLWRIRYLPVLSYGWIFTVYSIGSFLFSVAMTIAIPLAWPGSRNLLFASIVAMVVWPLSISLRLATIRRSDQGTMSRLVGVALLPLAALWYLLVLRQIRFYGIATCWRQSWVTRQHVEVKLDGSHDRVHGEAPPASHHEPAMLPRDGRGRVRTDERPDSWGGERHHHPPGASRYQHGGGDRRGAADPRRAPSPHDAPDPRRAPDPRHPRSARDPLGAGDPRVARDPRVAFERAGVQYPRLAEEARSNQRSTPFQEPGSANLPQAAREPRVRQQYPWSRPPGNGSQDIWQPRTAPYDRVRSMDNDDHRMAAQYQRPPSDFAPAEQSQSAEASLGGSRWLAPDPANGNARRNDIDPRGFEDGQAPLASPDHRTAPDRGRHVQAARDTQHPWDARAARPDPPIPRNRPVAPTGHLPEDRRAGFEAQGGLEPQRFPDGWLTRDSQVHHHPQFAVRQQHAEIPEHARRPIDVHQDWDALGEPPRPDAHDSQW